MGVLTLLAFLEFSKKLQNHEVLLSHILKDNGNYIQKSKCQNTATARLVKMLLHEKKNFFFEGNERSSLLESAFRKNT